jgi:hypothetical protein
LHLKDLGVYIIAETEFRFIAQSRAKDDLRGDDEADGKAAAEAAAFGNRSEYDLRSLYHTLRLERGEATGEDLHNYKTCKITNARGCGISGRMCRPWRPGL